MSGVPVELAVLLLMAIGLGLNLPLFLLLPFVLTTLPTLPDPVDGAQLLASGGPAGLGALLLVTSLLLRRVPGLHTLWRGVLAMAVVPAAGLLPFLVMSPERPTSDRVVAATACVLLAGLMQGLVSGRAILRAWDAPWPGRPIGGSEPLVTGLAVILTVSAALFWPSPLVLPILFLSLWLIWRYRAALRATAFVPMLTRGIYRHLSGESGWQVPASFPSWLRRSSGAGPGLKGTPSGLASAERIHGFRSGWLLLEGEALRFLYRSRFQVWEIDLELGPSRERDSLPWGLRVPVETDDSGRVILIPRHGPDPYPGLERSETGPEGQPIAPPRESL